MTNKRTLRVLMLCCRCRLAGAAAE